MKIHIETVTPAGDKALLFRTNAAELEILKALVGLALKNTLKIPATEDTVSRLKNIFKSFDSEVVSKWLEDHKV